MVTIRKHIGKLMKKINLLNETIVISNSELTPALNSNKEFGFTITGEIKFAPFDPVDIFIYQGKPAQAATPDLNISIRELLGTNYKIIEEDTHISLKAADAWQDIISYNIGHCDYSYTSEESVTQFADEEIEDMGWMIIDFDVSYKELIEMLEERADITLICVESQDPYRFSCMGYFNNIEETRKVLFDFCHNIIKDKIANDADYALDLLDEDQREAAEFFKVI